MHSQSQPGRHRQTGRFQRTAGQLTWLLVKLQANERPCLKNKVEVLRQTCSINLWPPHTCGNTHAYLCTQHKHTHLTSISGLHVHMDSHAHAHNINIHIQHRSLPPHTHAHTNKSPLALPCHEFPHYTPHKEWKCQFIQTEGVCWNFWPLTISSTVVQGQVPALPSLLGL